MLIGLTGGPGAGKSTAAGYLKKQGVAVISGDEIGKEVIENGPAVLKMLKRDFGSSIIDNKGRLDRRKLGGLVFGHDKELKKLNRIVHPRLLRILRARINDYKRRRRTDLIVVDAALIFEWGIGAWFDIVLTVSANRDIRISRLIKSGLSRSEAVKRISSQIPQRVKASRADYVIENNGSRGRLKREISLCLERLKRGTIR